MRNKLTVLLGGFFLLTVVLGMYSMSPPPKTVTLKVLKVAGVWQVVDASDSTKKPAKVNKKSTIIWDVEGTDTYFQFPDKLFDPVSATDSLNNGYTKFVKDGKKLKLKVKVNTPLGTYEYAIFCTADGVFAIGGSPPKIIVE